MMNGKWLFSLVVGIMSFAATSISSGEPLKMERAEALDMLRDTIDKIEGAVIPIPTRNWSCSPAPEVRICEAQIRPGLTIEVTEVPRDQAASGSFEKNGELAGVLEIMAHIELNSDKRTFNQFDNLCTALIATFRPNTTVQEAWSIYQMSMRRAANRSGDGGGVDVLEGKPISILSGVSQYDFRCTVTADSMYHID